MAPGATTVALATPWRRRAGARVQNVVLGAVRPGVQKPPFVIAGGAYRLVRRPQGSDQAALLAWMANADRPRRALRVAPSQVQVAAGIDREILERRQLARRRIHREALGHSAQVERHRTA